jgi:spore coat protein U-like protein
MKGASAMELFSKIHLTMIIVLFAAQCFAFTCSVTTTPVIFTNYDVFSTSPLNSTGTINVSCNNPEKKPIPVTIAISSGGSGKFNPRQMRAATGTDRLNYYLFTDPSRTTIWGDGTSGTSIVSNVVTKQSSFITTIYGMIPPRQNLSAGSFADSLVVTVNW